MLTILLDHLLLLIFAPAKAWKKIIRDKETETVIRTNFVFPLMGLVAAASLVGLLFSGAGLPIALKAACVSFLSLFLGFFSASYLLNELMPWFGVKKNLPRIQIFVGFSSCILYLMTFITELRFLSEFFFLQIFILYTFYVIWESVGIYFKEVATEERNYFVVCSTLLILLSPIVIRKIMGFLMPGLT